MYSVDFLLNTFAFDSISDNGILVFFIFGNYRANEFLLLPNSQTTIKVKDSLDINVNLKLFSFMKDEIQIKFKDHDCTSKFPSICSDAMEPYNDKVRNIWGAYIARREQCCW